MEPRNDERQAQLRLAAEALRGWIYARRATWSSEADDASEMSQWGEGVGIITDFKAPSEPPFMAPPTPFTQPSAFADAPPVFALQEPPLESPAMFDVWPGLDAEPPEAEPAKPAFRLRIPTHAVRSLAAPLIEWSARAAPVAAALVVLVGAGWMARPYAGKAKAWLTELTTTAPPKPEAVVAKPKSASGARPTGTLTARSEPAGARVLVDGRARGVTPLTLDDVTLGSHTVVIQSDVGSVRRKVTVNADRTAVVSESIFAGWLNVYAPFEIQISEGSHAIRLDEQNRVLLPPGPHDLQFVNRDLGYRDNRTVEVNPGQTTTLSLAPPRSTINVTSNVPAVVLIDGEPVGGTPLTNQPIALGTREVIVRSADGGERQFTTKVTVAPVQIDVDFSKQ